MRSSVLRVLCVLRFMVIVIHCAVGAILWMPGISASGLWKRSYQVHKHCFNGGLKGRDLRLQRFPEIMFGLTAIFLQEGSHPELDEVKTLPMSRILLEMESPHLLAPIHQQDTIYHMVWLLWHSVWLS